MRGRSSGVVRRVRGELSGWDSGRASVWIAVCVVMMALAGRSRGQDGPPPAMVRTGEVKRERLEQLREITGQVVTTRQSVIAARGEGLVVAFDLLAGDRVEKGAVLARLDGRIRELELGQWQAELGAAQAAIVEAEAELADVEAELSRQREADARGAASPADLERSELAVASSRARLGRARANVVAAEARLALARQRVMDQEIIAPFAGVVARIETQIGQWVGEGDPVVELVAIDRLEVVVDVPQEFVSVVAEEGRTIEVSVGALGRTAAERSVPGRFVTLVPMGDELSRTFRVRVALEGGGGLLRPGMSATAMVPTGSVAEFLTVPKDAVLRDDAGAYVYVMRDGPAGPMALPARVEPVFATGLVVAVRGDGVRAGDVVIVEGNERLWPTRPVIPMASGEAGGPGAGEADVGGRGAGGPGAAGEAGAGS